MPSNTEDERAAGTLMHGAIAAAVEACIQLAGAQVVVVMLPERGRLRAVARRGTTATQAEALARVLTEMAVEEHPAVLACPGAGPTALTMWADSVGVQLVVVRLDGSGTPAAALVTGSRTPHSGQAALRSGTALVAAQLGPALAAARRVAELERRDAGDRAQDEPDPAERLAQLSTALTAVLRESAAAPDVDEACAATARVVLGALPGVDTVHVWEKVAAGGQLRRVARVGRELVEGEPTGQISLDTPVGVATAVHENRTKVWRGDRSAWPERLRAFAEREGFRSAAHAPMYSAGRVVGALSLFSRADRPFSEAETAFLTAVGGQLGGQVDSLRGIARVEEERRGLRAVIETLPEGLILFDRGGRIRLFNHVASRLLGPQEGGPGAGWQVGLTVRTSDPAVYLPAAEAMKGIVGREMRGAEVTVRRPDGSELPVLVNAGPVPAADGGAGGTVLVFQDITHLKELERLKDDFINMVSHELRTPTTTVRGGALTLLRRWERLDEETRRALLQDIADESERLHHLVEDLLSLSRSQRGMQLAPEPLRLHRLVSKVVISLGPRLGGVPLSVDVPPDLPLAEADPEAVEQVLRNLVENAVRHSPRAGRVEISATVRGAELMVSVLDRGAGLAAGEEARVFEPFYRSPAAVDAGTQGAGLGLAVCKRLVELSGGSIWAERRPRGGAIFRFTLPAATVEEE